ncbi:MAG TPA: IspD/TarI family cytidylyltransferase [Bacteroidales bacterium]|nr:IspD/TarI family cytidylyltransferase [Bacteroidales bacterium]
MSEQVVYVLILSGGSGNRFGNVIPKQFADVYGKTILDYCVSNFNNHKSINKIIVVSNPEHIQRTKQIVSGGKFPKVISVIEGGATRGESSYLGLLEIARIEKETQNIKVLIQDAVRPYTNKKIIDDVIEKLGQSNAVTVAVATTDTIYIAGNNGKLEHIPDRSKLLKAQTPQGFSFDLILKAYQKHEKVNRFRQTDDVSIVNKIFPEEDIFIAQGDINNVKITFSEDLEYLRQILKTKR